MKRIVGFLKTLWRIKAYVIMGVVVVLFLLVSALSLTSIQQLQANFHVVNLVGSVRGESQVLFKKELQGYPDDDLIQQLDIYLSELMTGIGSNNIIVLRDASYMDNLRRVQSQWVKIKLEIQRLRAGEPADLLFELSEEYSTIMEETALSVDAYAEAQAEQIMATLISANIVFIALMVLGLIFFAHAISVQKRADALGKIAYVDALTQLPNRVSCQRTIERYNKRPPSTELAVLMFDMFNLERVNDRFGHQAGDQIISAFAQILKEAGERYGFVGRYGGDEFIALFEGKTAAVVQGFLTVVRNQVDAYNGKHSKTLEHINYVVGQTRGSLHSTTLADMIRDADRLMYVEKRKASEA